MMPTEKHIKKLEGIAEKTLLWCNTAQSNDWVNELRKEISDIFIQQKKGDKIMTPIDRKIYTTWTGIKTIRIERESCKGCCFHKKFAYSDRCVIYNFNLCWPDKYSKKGYILKKVKKYENNDPEIEGSCAYRKTIILRKS